MSRFFVITMFLQVYIFAFGNMIAKVSFYIESTAEYTPFDLTIFSLCIIIYLRKYIVYAKNGGRAKYFYDYRGNFRQKISRSRRFDRGGGYRIRRSEADRALRKRRLRLVSCGVSPEKRRQNALLPCLQTKGGGRYDDNFVAALRVFKKRI